MGDDPDGTDSDSASAREPQPKAKRQKHETKQGTQERQTTGPVAARYGADDEEESEADMIAEDIAAAQAEATSNGTELAKDRIANIVKTGKAKAKAARASAGKFKLISRGKNAAKPAGSDQKNCANNGDD